LEGGTLRGKERMPLRATPGRRGGRELSSVHPFYLMKKRSLRCTKFHTQQERYAEGFACHLPPGNNNMEKKRKRKKRKKRNGLLHFGCR